VDPKFHAPVNFCYVSEELDVELFLDFELEANFAEAEQRSVLVF